MEWFALAVGGGLGAMLRGILLRIAGPEDQLDWPPRGPAAATLLANTLGCLIFGVWVAQEANWLAETPHALTVRQAVTGGLCGGLTTFSSLCADAFRLARGFAPVASILYVALTIILGLAAFFAGSSLE